MPQARKKILVLGANGMLGNDIVRVLTDPSSQATGQSPSLRAAEDTPSVIARRATCPPKPWRRGKPDEAIISPGPHPVIGLDLPDIDISDETGVRAAVREHTPAVVINCAAYTDVDGCETNKERAFLVNAEGVKILAQECKTAGALLVHFSTDYIFDGTKEGPYVESDMPNPINTYGKSKLAGERFIRDTLEEYVIIRTSWLFGKHGKNFVRTMLSLAQTKNEIPVVNDQRGSPTYTLHLASATQQLIASEATGIFNVTNNETCSWFEFAAAIFKAAQLYHIRVIPISSEQLDRPARRPRNSALDGQKFRATARYTMPHWHQALEEYLENTQTP